MQQYSQFSFSFLLLCKIYKKACRFGNFTYNVESPFWRTVSPGTCKPRSSPVTPDLSLNLSESSMRVPFSHIVCAALCSARVGTNSGDLPATWPLPALPKRFYFSLKDDILEIKRGLEP